MPRGDSSTEPSSWSLIQKYHHWKGLFELHGKSWSRMPYSKKSGLGAVSVASLYPQVFVVFTPTRGDRRIRRFWSTFLMEDDQIFSMVSKLFPSSTKSGLGSCPRVAWFHPYYFIRFPLWQEEREEKGDSRSTFPMELDQTFPMVSKSLSNSKYSSQESCPRVLSKKKWT